MIKVIDFENIISDIDSDDFSFTIFCSVDNLDIQTTEIFNIHIVNDIWLTNDFNKIDSIKIENFANDLGNLNIGYLINSKIFAYTKKTEKKYS